jgi:hypothetical protein
MDKKNIKKIKDNIIDFTRARYIDWDYYGKTHIDSTEYYIFGYAQNINGDKYLIIDLNISINDHKKNQLSIYMYNYKTKSKTKIINIENISILELCRQVIRNARYDDKDKNEYRKLYRVYIT